MSSQLSWMIIRNNNAFLVKKRNIRKPFSKEPNNLTNLSSFRYNGLIHKKTVGIEAGKTADKKSFCVVTKIARSQFRPSKSAVRTEMKTGPRRSLTKLRRLLNKNKYRRDLTKLVKPVSTDQTTVVLENLEHKNPLTYQEAALRRASAVLASQRPVPTKKPKAAKKTE